MKITQALADRVRQAAPGQTRRELAAQFGIARATVDAIVKGTWKSERRDECGGTGEILFTHRRLWCEDCQRIVFYTPCPVCIARAAKKSQTGVAV